MAIERNYDFRRRIDEVHVPGRRDPAAVRDPGKEYALPERTVVSLPDLADPVLVHAAEDLQDYLLRSMGIGSRLACGDPDADIVLETSPDIGSEGGYRFAVDESRVVLTGNEGKGVFNAVIHLEDLMNLREAPFLEFQSEVHRKLVTPRMVHSGWGIELYPDSHLNAIAHAGFDTIVVFVTGIDRTNVGHLDINSLIHRAALHGLDVMLYSYMPVYHHPDEEDAQRYFDEVYTTLFRAYPGARGVMLVGESAEFPSRDPRTTGRSCRESVHDGIPDVKPSPGWFPCRDYPDWLARVSRAVRKAKPDALIVFNTYNWGWADEMFRREFLERLPKDIVLQVTFEIFKRIQREGLACSVMDYTISAADPGFYFTSECRNAAALGLKLLATANTAGATWDFGTVGHVPVPQRWMHRFERLDQARRDWGLCRFYDNHHYGWEPSVVTDLGRAYFWSPQADMQALLPRLAARDFGKAAEKALQAWDRWSEAMGHYTATNEDQYGPFRVGPAYPFIFHPNLTRTMDGKEIRFPTMEGAHFGHRIIKTFYQPYENAGQAPGSLRMPVELRSLERMKSLWLEGLALLEEGLALVEPRKRENLESELNRGRYILANIQTAINMKKWYLLNIGLLNAATPEECRARLDGIRRLAREEMDNARNAIPLVERDSRLGWEPSMEYVADRWHLEWKLRQMESMLREVDAFEKIIP